MSFVAGNPVAWRPNKRRRADNKSTNSTALVTVSKKQVDLNQSALLRKLVRVTKGLTPERKVFDTALSFINVADTTGAIQSILAIEQGDTILNRTANKIRVKSVFVQVRVSTASIDAIAEAFARFAIVQDTQADTGSAPTGATIFTSPGLPQSALLNVVAQGRFKILFLSPLWDLTRVRSTNATQSATYAKTLYKLDIPVTYPGTSTSVQKNDIFVVMLTSVTTDVLDADGVARVTYTDD